VELVQHCSHIQAKAGVCTSVQQLHCLGTSLKDLENYMCSQVTPRQLVNSTKKGCHTDKSDLREDMARSLVYTGWQETQLLPAAHKPPLTHGQHLPGRDQKAAHPSTSDGGFVLVLYCPALLTGKQSGIIYLLLSTRLGSS